MIDAISISLITAFFAGIFSFLSPCVLPLVPEHITYVADKSLVQIRETDFSSQHLRIVWLSLNFVFGFSLLFISLGATATIFGQTLLAYRYEAEIIAGAVTFCFGLHMMCALPTSWLNRDLRIHANIPKRTPIGSIGLGITLMTGTLSRAGTWLLMTFPSMQRLVL